MYARPGQLFGRRRKLPRDAPALLTLCCPGQRSVDVRSVLAETVDCGEYRADLCRGAG